MCLSTVYVTSNGEMEKVMQDVAKMEAKDDGFVFENLFGEENAEARGEALYQMQEFAEWDDIQISEYEKEVLGFYFKAHPMIKYKEMAEQHGAVPISEIVDIPAESAVTIFSIVTSLKKILTKDKKEMAFITCDDLSGTVETVVFPSIFEKYAGHLDGKRVIVITGRLSGEKILADRILYPEEFVKESVSQMHVVLKNPFDEDKLLKLRDIFIHNRGRCNVYIHTPELDRNQKAVRASTFLLVEPGEELISQIKKENLVERVWVS